MREIGYKPYRCGHCYDGKGTGYSEPSRSAMGKHFRYQHRIVLLITHCVANFVSRFTCLCVMTKCHEYEKACLGSMKLSTVCLKFSGKVTFGKIPTPQI